MSLTRRKSSGSLRGARPAIYFIHVRLISGSKLAAREKGSSDPYVVAHLEGSKTKVTSPHISNTINPVWNCELEPLPGRSIGNDILKLRLFHKDRKGQTDSLIGFAELRLRDVPLGTTVDKTIPLLKADKKGKADKKSKPGSGGELKISLNLGWAGLDPFLDSPWTWPFYTAIVEFISASDIPIGDIKTSDPYLVYELSQSANDQKGKTKVIKNTLSPVWKEKREFILGDPDDEVLSVTLFDKDQVTDDEKMSTVEIPLKGFRRDGQWEDGEYPMTPLGSFTKGGTLKIRIQLKCDNPGGHPAKGLTDPKRYNPDELDPDFIEPEPIAAEPVAPDAAPAEAPIADRAVDLQEAKDGGDSGPCREWGNYSSSYATDFTGYEECSERLSDLHSDEKGFHNHEWLQVAEVKRGEAKLFTLNGTIVNGRGLPHDESEANESYVVVNIANKGGHQLKPQQTAVVAGGANPDYDFAFDFGEVKKGRAVEFTVVTTDKGEGGEGALAVAYGVKDVKDIELDNGGVIEIALREPKKQAYKQLKWDFSEWGTLSVILNQALKVPEG